MKNATKKKIVAVAAVFGLITLISTFALITINHPDQWAVGYTSIFAIGVGLFTACTIEN